MATKVVMPSQGQSEEPATLVAWKYSEGDRVNKGDILCEVESDKATFEVEASDSGVLLKRLYRNGDLVPVLATIGFIGQPGKNSMNLPTLICRDQLHPRQTMRFKRFKQPPGNRQRKPGHPPNA
jgi:pyruvate/2-oxoglutarate dehydrogenase complex dihydrolipoamide acyltransferase (E2) component